jgi:hypothetical protein
MKKKWFLDSFLLSLLVCSNVECRIGCIYEGYDGGYLADKKTCACYNLITKDIFVAKKLPRTLKEFKPPELYDDRPVIHYDSD